MSLDDKRPASRALLLAMSAVPLTLHLIAAASPHYGYFIDELYYLACARHLAFGYVDHPPLAPAVLALTRLVFGDSALGIRVAPFLASGATVWVTGLLVRELGGGRFATLIAALSVGLAPVLLSLTSFFSMNAFEPLLWTLTMFTLVRLARATDGWRSVAARREAGRSAPLLAGRARLWLAAGLLLGLGVENKHTAAAFALALLIGMLATGARRAFRDPWLWAGLGLALLLALPNVIWQAASGWPSLEFYRNAQTLKNIPSPPLQSVISQALVMSPATVPVWLAGLVFLLGARAAKSFRFVAVTFLAAFALYLASRTSRADRLAAAYPAVIAAGGVAIERWLKNRAGRAASVAGIVLVALALAPVALPLLPPPLLARYVQTLGLTGGAERGKSAPLPQLLADRTGWESFVDDVTRVYRALPPDQQARALIYVPDYGHAGAVDLWGPRLGLPPVIAPHNSYWHWSVGRLREDNVLIAVGASPEALSALYAEVRPAGIVTCDYCMSWRSHMPIFVARRPKVPLAPVWASLRHYE